MAKYKKRKTAVKAAQEERREAQRPAPEQLARLGELCSALVRERWAAGQDLLGLGAYRALWGGQALDAEKNACPPLRTDVAIY